MHNFDYSISTHDFLFEGFVLMLGWWLYCVFVIPIIFGTMGNESPKIFWRYFIPHRIVTVIVSVYGSVYGIGNLNYFLFSVGILCVAEIIFWIKFLPRDKNDYVGIFIGIISALPPTVSLPLLLDLLI